MKIPKEVKKAAKWGAVLGFVLSLLCQYAPPDYRVACETVVKLCTGGL